MKAHIFFLFTILTSVNVFAQGFTNQPVQNVSLLRQGMSKQEVIKVMGQPMRTEFQNALEAFHFCRTGSQVDEFAVVVFKDGRVVSAKNYTVSVAQTGGVTGDCSLFIRPVF